MICDLSCSVVRSCVKFHQCVVPRSSVLWMITNYLGNAGLILLVPEYNSTILASAALFLKLVASIRLSLKHKSRHLPLKNTNCFGLPKLSRLLSKP